MSNLKITNTHGEQQVVKLFDKPFDNKKCLKLSINGQFKYAILGDENDTPEKISSLYLVDQAGQKSYILLDYKAIAEFIKLYSNVLSNENSTEQPYVQFNTVEDGNNILLSNGIYSDDCANVGLYKVAKYDDNNSKILPGFSNHISNSVLKDSLDIDGLIKLGVKYITKPEDCDYYFTSRQDFKDRINQICIDNNQDLSQKTFGFADNVTFSDVDISNVQNIKQYYQENVDYIKFPNTIVATPKTIYSKGMTSTYMLFGDINNNQSNLKKISDTLFLQCPNLTKLHYTFCNCNNIVNIPSNLFKKNNKLIELINTFDGCKSLKLLPYGLLKNKFEVLTAKGVFRNSGIISIPETIFDSCEKLNDISGAFDSCSDLLYVSNILKKCKNISKLNNLFSNCTSLETVNNELFRTCDKVKNFDRVFYRCNKLKNIPTDLFSGLYKLESLLETFYECSSLTNIPEDLFLNNINLKNLTGTFQKCSSVAEISENLFTNSYLINTFERTFAGCSNVIELKNIFKQSFEASNFKETFADCSNLNKIYSYLFFHKNKVENIEGTFSNCVGLINIPATLFDNQFNIKNCRRTFYNCSNLTSKLPEIWYRNTTRLVEDYGYNCKKAANYKWLPYTWCSEPYPETPRDCDYYFETILDFYKRIDQIAINKNYDLGDVSFGFGDDVKELLLNSTKSCFGLIYDLKVPPKLIYGNNIENCSYLFGLNKFIEKISPSIFDKTSKIKEMKSFFSSNIPFIPVDLFDNCRNVVDFEHCFSNSTSLTSIPSGLFDNCPNAVSFKSCFNGCTSLTTIPKGLFDKNVNAVSFESCFSGCSLLTSIPSGLFDNCKKAEKFDSCFMDCVNITSSIPIVWNNENIPNFKTANLYVMNCKKASNFKTEIPSSIFCGGLVQKEPEFKNTVDYYFETIEDFKKQIKQILTDNNNDLSLKSFGFSDFVYSLYEAFSKTEIISTPKKIYGNNIYKFNSCFKECKSLTTIQPGLFDNCPNATSFENCFDSCPLTSIPSGLFDNCPNVTSFEGCFAYTRITSIPFGLFNKNVNATNFKYCFYNSRIASIPSGLFNKNVNAVNFKSCFSRCDSLTTIPHGLFDNCPNATSFEGCFGNCTSLTTLPSSLFSNKKADNFHNCFQNCNLLTTINSNLFSSDFYLVNFSNCFYECKSLATIPADLFDNCPNATNFEYCFSSSSLTSIPAGLFDKNVNAINFSGCFTYCTSLTTIPKGLFDKNVNAVSFKKCFSVCSLLTSIPSGLFSNCPNATDFEYCFNYNSKLVTIPTNLFGKNNNKINFSGCFSYCEILTNIPADLFENCPNATNFEYCFSFSYDIIIPPKLFNKNINAVSFRNCFSRCDSLTTVPFELFDNCPNVTNFEGCFSFSYNITSNIPDAWNKDKHPNVVKFSDYVSSTKIANYDSVPAGWK